MSESVGEPRFHYLTSIDKKSPEGEYLNKEAWLWHCVECGCVVLDTDKHEKVCVARDE